MFVTVFRITADARDCLDLWLEFGLVTSLV